MTRRRRWFGRCRVRRLGPFLTEWRCLLDRSHPGPHWFEPDEWRARRAAGGIVDDVLTRTRATAQTKQVRRALGEGP